MRWFSLVVSALGLLGLVAAGSLASALRELTAPPADLPSERASPARPEGALPALDRERLSALTGLRLGHSTPPGAGPTQGASECAQRHPILLGTLLSLADEDSAALVQPSPTAAARTLRLGQVWEGALVERIDRERVSVRRQGVLECLEPRGGGGPRAVTLSSPREPGLGVRAPSPGWYEVSRAELDAARGQLMRLSSQVMVVPAYDHGVPSGFRVARVQSGSFIARLGIQQGDVLMRVNGADVTDADGLIRLYGQLGSLTELELELLRDGVRVRQRYRVN